MSETILLMGPLFDSTMLELESRYKVHRYWEATDKAALFASIGERCTGVVTDGGLGVSNDVIDKLPNARIVSVFGVGVDAIDLERCSKAGIAVGNTPDVLSADVADLAVALALGICRNMIVGDRHARSGNWQKHGAMPLSVRMSGKKAGIFGMGSIGERLAQRLAAFDMQISYCNRSKKADSPYRFVDTLQALASESDFLFVTAAATSSTVGAVDGSVLEALGRDGFLVNVSRGTLVDESALIAALNSKQIAGAGLDVFANEPAIPAELCKLDNVVMQPHHASGTFETRKAMGDLMLANLDAHFAGKALLTRVV